MNLGRVISATLIGGMVSAALFSFTHAMSWAESRTVVDGVYTLEQATRGQELYAERCEVCHGVGLEGADVNPPLAGSRFLANWNSQSVRDLTTRTRTTMPLDDPGSMSASETADVIAYVLQKNDFAAGDSELPRTSQGQQAILIIAVE